MIPKKIHYCWFGNGEKSKKAIKCIQSWKKYCPDYEIIEWNENNFDLEMNPYVKYVYENKKYAFLSDYARLCVIYKEGGIYFDVDVEVIRPLDELLSDKSFFGFETKEYVNTGMGFGAEAGNPIIEQMLQEYDKLLDGQHGVIGCPILNTDALLKFGLVQDGCEQELEFGKVYPIEYFNPYDDPTGRLMKTGNTFSIHWYAKSWMDKKTIIRSKFLKPVHRLLRRGRS